MEKLIVLGVHGTTAEAMPHKGDQAQSFNLVSQGDGSIGIRNFYYDSVLDMSNEWVRAVPHNGTQPQSFKIVEQEDGSCVIQSYYYNTVLTMTEHTLQALPFVAGDRNQRFDIVDQGDGSKGLRKVSRSLFSGTVDPLDAIKRVGNWFRNSTQQCTGFYAPPGTLLSLELNVEGSIAASKPTLWIGATYADPDLNFSKPRAYPLSQGLNRVSDPGGGMIYLEFAGEENTANLSFTSGAVEAPFFEHLKTTPAQYRQMLARWTTPYVELTSACTVVTVNRAAALTYKDSDQNELMAIYEYIIAIQEHAVLGLAQGSREPLKYQLILGNYGGPGGAHATHGYTAYGDYLTADLLVPERLKSSWGVFHELGHQNQMLGYLASDFIEVTNNIHALAVQRAFGRPSRLLDPEPNGLNAWDTAMSKRGAPGLKISDLGAFERLAALEQLRLAFDPLFFWLRLNSHIREQWPSNGWRPNDVQAFNNLALSASIIAGADLRDYFADWGMPLSTAGQEAVKALNLPAAPERLKTVRETKVSRSGSWVPSLFADVECCGVLVS